MTTLARTGPITSRRWRLGKRWLLIVGLTVFAIWTLFPIAWMIETSLKPDADIYGAPGLWPARTTVRHYIDLFSQDDFGTYFKNSLLVAVATTALAVVIGILAAYALTRLEFRGRRFVANVTVVTYLVPPSLLFIPLFQVAFQFGFTDRAMGLVPLYLIFTVPFCTWLALAYMKAIPRELEESSLVDGANRLQALRMIIVPLILPAVAVIALFTFTQAWNEFLYALILISSTDQKTLPVGLMDFINGDVLQWGPLMAGSLLGSLPPILIYMAAQRWVVSGLSAGAVTG